MKRKQLGQKIRAWWRRRKLRRIEMLQKERRRTAEKDKVKGSLGGFEVESQKRQTRHRW